MIKVSIFIFLILPSLTTRAQRLTSRSLCQNIISSYGPTKYDKPLFNAQKDLETIERRSESTANSLKIEKLKATIKILKDLKRKQRATDLQDCLKIL